MPSQLHESHLLLFRNQPALAAQLIRDALGVRLQARENPELAVLSAMAHGRDADPRRAIEIAMAAQKASCDLDPDRSDIYSDLILSSLGEAARKALRKMDARTYEWQSALMRKNFARGRAQGETSGRVALILRLLASRFGPVGVEIEHRVQRASIPELDLIGERLLGARTVEEALD